MNTQEVGCVVAGTAIYVMSFFLPAVSEAGYTSHPIPGYFCAFITLAALHEIPRSGKDLFLIPIGLINPLVLLYLALLRIHGAGAGRARLGISITTAAFVAATWIFLATYRVSVDIGHIAWIAGIFLIMAPGFRRLREILIRKDSQSAAVHR